jgi:hypothetical protein
MHEFNLIIHTYSMIFARNNSNSIYLFWLIPIQLLTDKDYIYIYYNPHVIDY